MVEIVVVMRGFTLLEVLIVMMLIAVLTSLAVLLVGGGIRERLAEEAQRLAAIIELHQQEAILSGEPRGILFTEQDYTLFSLDQGQWQLPEMATGLTQRTLPEDITLSLWVENRPVDIRAAKQPQVLLQNSGEMTEFVVVFSSRKTLDLNTPRYQVASDALGRLESGEVKP